MLGGAKGRRIALLAFIVFLGLAASAVAAFQELPTGGQVNDDPAAGINKTLSVGSQDPTNADVVGGALNAGSAAIPWAIFRQATAAGHDQVFSRSFAGGAWMTRGAGTVGGSSSAAPTFSGSLNFDQGQDGEAPAIDFAGAGRTVPWATWYEDTAAFGGKEQVFASRFDNNGDANQNKWIFAGQGRGLGTGTVPVPSLNINTGQAAENPSVAGGSTADPTKPGPWVTWQETSTAAGHPDQIFVSKPEGPGMANCDGVTPAGVVDGTGHVPAIGGFCFQQTGVDRFGSGTLDPSLNVDPTRNGIEPDIAFTGTNDTVPWVVWYEEGTGTIGGLHTNETVFAAKGVANVAADGGFEWVAVGNARSGKLDASEANKLGGCAISSTVEGECSLNKNAEKDAEDPRVAAGTMTAGQPTVPWVSWDETLNGVKQVFVSRLVGSGATAHFELVNNGAPISVGANDSTRPDITFSGNTPYVSWREDVGGGVEKAFVGHFVDAATPAFVLDGDEVPLTPTAQADVREPIASSCAANPFDADGSACQGGAIGTPFFLFTNGTATRGLFADAYQPVAPLTEAASAVGPSPVAPGVPLLRPPVVIVGKATASKPTISGTTASVRVSCSGLTSATCRVTLELTVTEQFQGHRLLAVTAAAKAHRTRKLLVVGSASVLLKPGHAQIVRLGLNRAGKRLLAIRHGLKATLRVTAATATAIPASILTRVLTFKPAKRH
jgi:hypothetical protein